jgi:hypothetical protein
MNETVIGNNVSFEYAGIFGHYVLGRIDEQGTAVNRDGFSCATSDSVAACFIFGKGPQIGDEYVGKRFLKARG